MSVTNKIEKIVELNAPVGRVWSALTNAKEFGSWFGVELEGPFIAGQRVRGQFTMGKNKLPGLFFIDRLDREAGVFSYHWHPGAIDPDADYRDEPMTIVIFTVTETPTGTHLVITESGFDGLPPERRTHALADNTRGWGIQAERIVTYVAKVA